MQNKPLVSVIIPCYNVEKYLNRCMESVVNQTYLNLEIILVDDGSPDNTGIICDNWTKLDKRVKVIHKLNEGLGFARNSGIQMATGEFIAFVDSDDYVNLSMYEELIDAAVQTSSDIVYCGHIKQLSNGSDMGVSDFESIKTFEKNELLELSKSFFMPTEASSHMLTMSVWHAVYKRDIIKHKFYSEREVGSEDIHFQIKAILASQRITFIPNQLYVYCYNGESLSHTFLFDKIDRYKHLGNLIHDTYLINGENVYFDYYVFLIAFVSIRQVMMSKYTEKLKKSYIKKVVSDEFWINCHLDINGLSFSKKVFFISLKKKSATLMYVLAKIYSMVVYTLGKKAIQ